MKSFNMEADEGKHSENFVEIAAQIDSENSPQKQRRQGSTIEHPGLMSRGKYALDPKLAGTSRIHGTALIYRNDRLKVGNFRQKFLIILRISAGGFVSRVCLESVLTDMSSGPMKSRRSLEPLGIELSAGKTTSWLRPAPPFLSNSLSR